MTIVKTTTNATVNHIDSVLAYDWQEVFATVNKISGEVYKVLMMLIEHSEAFESEEWTYLTISGQNILQEIGGFLCEYSPDGDDAYLTELANYIMQEIDRWSQEVDTACDQFN